MDIKPTNEQRYYDTLKRIAQGYHPSEWFTDEHARWAYGEAISGEEALVMAYDNMQADAAAAIFGRRRPKK